MFASEAWLRLNLLSVWRRPVRVWDQSFAPISLDRLVYLFFHRLGWMGRSERTFLEQHVQAGMCVVDIGANLGLYTLLLSRLVGPTGCVIGIEPDPELFGALQANCRENRASNVELHNLAAGSERGRSVLHRSGINAGDNRLARHESAVSRSVEVNIATLDEIVRGRRVDFIKMDVQGWEGEVIAGMQQVLTNPELQICFEYWPYGLRNAGHDPESILSVLGHEGFQIYPLFGELPVAGPETRDSAWVAPRGKNFTNLYAVRHKPV